MRPATFGRGAPKKGGSRHYITEFLDPESEWGLVSQGHKFTEGPAADLDGNVYFTDIPNNRIHRVGADGKVSLFAENTGGANGLMFGPDGKLYAAQGKARRVVAYDPKTAKEGNNILDKVRPLPPNAVRG